MLYTARLVKLVLKAGQHTSKPESSVMDESGRELIGKLCFHATRDHVEDPSLPKLISCFTHTLSCFEV